MLTRMSSPCTDRLGRATFHYIAPRDDVRPTEREVRWLKHIERHGAVSSEHLYELTRDTHRCRDTALRQLQKLRAGGFLRLPPQQRQTADAAFQPYIYDLDRRGRAHLVDLGLAEPTVRPTGHWWHAHAVSRVTSALEIVAARRSIRFIPAHEILAIKSSTLAVPIAGQRLIPDQLFALDYGGSFRAFTLEVDRGTEPKVSSAKRKSWQSAIALYDQLLQGARYKQHWGLKANLLVLWVFARRSDQERFLGMVGDRRDSGSAVFASATTHEQAFEHAAAAVTEGWRSATPNALPIIEP
ncbi:MAG: replication-relaxation family protein [Pseudomonadota bacterium]